MKFTKIALAATLLAATSFAANAGPGHKHERKDYHQIIMKKLDLTEQQKSEVEALKSQKKQQMDAAHEQMKSLKEQIHTAMQNDNYDSGQVRTLLHRLADLKADTMQHKHTYMQQMKSILTPEQQAKMKELKAKLKEKHKDKHEHRS